VLKSMLVVTVPATSQALTDLATVRDELGIDTGMDAKLTRYIGAASRKIVQYCNRSFGTETLEETWRRPANPAGSLLHNLSDDPLILSRYPVQSISSIIVDGVTMTADTDYKFDGETGRVYRLDANGRQSAWTFNYTLVVTYVAGYVLLSGLPDEVGFAALNLVRLLYYTQARDPTVKAESTVGVDSATYDISGSKDGEMSPEDQILSTLENYRVPVVGAL
jgi:hypothetical protein